MIKNIIKQLLTRNPTRANYKFVLKDWTALKDINQLGRVLETKRFSRNLDPILIDYPKAKKILVFSPHPDDDIFSSGGTLLKSLDHGAEIKTIYVTCASSAIKEEAMSVSRQIGTKIEFWGYDKKAIPINSAITRQTRDAIDTFDPDAVFLPFLTDDHEDHRRVSELFYATFKNAPPRCEIFAYQVYSTVLPNVVVDITDVMEKKLRLINIWESQKVSRDWAHYVKGLNGFNCRFLKTNEPRYVETFFVVSAEEYIKLCAIYYE